MGASAELEACAACHSRRKMIAPKPRPASRSGRLSAGVAGARPLSRRRPDRRRGLRIRLVHPEPLHPAGVTCSNCHEPHSRAARGGQRALRAMPPAGKVRRGEPPSPPTRQCRRAMRQLPHADEDLHGRGSRRDHSVRVPRPDLSVSLGTPNACTQCHADRPAKWAAETLAGWYPAGRQTTPHYATALHAGRTGAADAEQQLDRLILDAASRQFARASASAVAECPTPRPLPSRRSRRRPRIPDPLVRVRRAARLPGAVARRSLSRAIAPLLSDPVRAVRIETARALARNRGHPLTQERNRFGQRVPGAGSPPRWSTPTGRRRISILGCWICDGGNRRGRNGISHSFTA